MTTDEHELHRWREALAQEPADVEVPDLVGADGEEPPWRWRTLVEALAPTADRVLDLDVEGAGLRSLPARSVDLVLSRRGPFHTADVVRVLRPGGAVLAEQAGEDDGQELRAAFDLPGPCIEASLEAVVHELVTAGLRVDRSDTFHGLRRLADMPTLLGHLRRAPWIASEDLDVDRCRPALERLRDALADSPLEVTVSRFVVLARAPRAPDAGRVDFGDLPHGDLEVPRV